MPKRKVLSKFKQKPSESSPFQHYILLRRPDAQITRLGLGIAYQHCLHLIVIVYDGCHNTRPVCAHSCR